MDPVASHRPTDRPPLASQQTLADQLHRSLRQWQTTAGRALEQVLKGGCADPERCQGWGIFEEEGSPELPLRIDQDAAVLQQSP